MNSFQVPLVYFFFFILMKNYLLNLCVKLPDANSYHYYLVIIIIIFFVLFCKNNLLFYRVYTL